MADRSVTVKLEADVRPYIIKIGQAEAAAKKLRQELGRPWDIKPIRPDVQDAEARKKLDDLRQRIAALSDRKIDVDVDGADARAEIDAIERELRDLAQESADIDVRVDTAKALADLRALESSMSRVENRSARVKVDADVGGALASIGMVGAALASLPAVTTVAVGVMALGSAFAAAGAGAASFAAVAIPSLGRINEALTAQESAAKGAGAATGGAGRSAAQAASQALALEQAERRVIEAQEARKRAQEDLTRATEAGRRALEDMNFSLERSVLSQKDAALAIREAEARLAELQADPKATQLELERAMLGVEQAHQRAREQEVMTKRAKEDTAVANKAGVKGTEEYQQAVERLATAEAAAQQATQQLKVAQMQATESMSGGGGAANTLKDAFAELSKQEKALAKDIKVFKDEYLDWQRSLQPEVFPAIHQGLDLMRLGLREAGPLASSAGVAFLQLGEDAEEALTGQFWQQFLFNVGTQAPTAIVGLGRSFGHVTTGVAGVIDAFLPWTPTVVGGLESAAKAFADWGKELKTSEDFAEFMLFVKEHAPEAWELVTNLAKALMNTGEALSGLGVGALGGLNLLAKLVAGMDPAHIQAIALALVAIKTAQAGLGVARFFTEIPGRLTAVREGFDKAKTAGSKFGDVVGNLKEKAGGLGSALAGGAALTGGLLLLEGRLNDNAVAAGRFADKIQTVAGDDVDAQIRAITDELARLHEAVGPVIDLEVVKLAPMDWDGNINKIDELEARLAELRHQKDLNAISSKAAGGAMATMGDQASSAADKMSGLNTSLGTFASRTDALKATRDLKDAFDDAKTAIEAASGKLEINARMTDTQRDAVIRAREAFSGLITQVKTSADSQASLTGRTTEARDAILKQIPELMQLAGKNKDAQTQVLALASAYGISEADARKAAKGGQDLVEVLAKLKSKDVRIGADTKPAQEAIDNFIKLNSGRKIPLSVYTKQSQLAAGAVMRYAAGGIEDPVRMASGGRLTPPPHIQDQPTILYGEGNAPEAFIPYDPVFRGRAVDLLSQVADDFGLRLMDAQRASNGGSSGGMVAGHYGTGSAVSTMGGSSSLVNYSTASAPQTGSYLTIGNGYSGGSSGVSVNVDMSGATINREADVDRLAAQIGWEYTNRA